MSRRTFAHGFQRTGTNQNSIGDDRLSANTLRPMLGREYGPDLFHNRLEGGWIRDRQLRQLLTIQLNLSFLQSMDEYAVSHVVLLNRCTNTNDPESTEIAATTTTVSVGIDASPNQVLFCGTIQSASTAYITASSLK
jgi:hypothetical protein